ncbi:MAG: hypothetical protein R6U51_02125 [Anaerolineales bacterium]
MNVEKPHWRKKAVIYQTIPRNLSPLNKEAEILLSTRLDRTGPDDGPRTLRPLEGLNLDL